MSVDTHAEQSLGQLAQYQPTPFADEQWPQLNKDAIQHEFAPLHVPKVAEQGYAVDPMFANFDLETAPEPISEGIEETARPTMPVAERFESTSADQESVEMLHGQDPEKPEAVHDMPTTSENLDLRELEPSEIAATASKSKGGDGDVDIAEEASMRDTHEPLADTQIELEPTLQAHADGEAASEEVDKGYAQGVADTRAEVDELKASLERQFQELVDDLQAQVSEALHAHEQGAVELALQVARKLVGEVVASHGEYILAIVSEALQSIAGSEVKSIRVSPRDFDFLSAPTQAERFKRLGSGGWSFESDESIRAGCVVVTNAGEIDFDLEKAWARLREKILKGPQVS